MAAFFSIVWLGWGPDDPPGWVSRALVAGSVLAAVIGVAGIVTALLRRAPTSGRRSPSLNRRYGRIVVVELVLIGTGAAILAASDGLDWLPVWVALVVGAHFLPLARLVDDPTMCVVGVLICLGAVVAASAALWADIAPAAITGPVTGFLLLGAALLTLGGSLGPTPTRTQPSIPPSRSRTASEGRRDGPL